MSATGAGRNILNWTKRQQLGIDPPPEEDGKPSKTEEAAPAADAPTAASTSVRTKARQGTQAAKKGQEPRPPLTDSETLAPGTGEALVTQAPLSTTREMVQVSAPSEDVLQYLKERRWRGHRQGGPPPGSDVRPTDLPIGGYTIGDQKPPLDVQRIDPAPQRRGFKGVASVGPGPKSTPQDVAARLMNPKPPKSTAGSTEYASAESLEKYFAYIPPITFTPAGGINFQPLTTPNELTESLEYVSIPVLRRYQKYLIDELKENQKTEQAIQSGSAFQRLGMRHGISRRQLGQLEQRQAKIEEYQEQARRLSTIMKAMARRAGVSDEELK